jgi:hypothetical protein
VRGLDDDGAHDERRSIDERGQQLAARTIDIAIRYRIAIALGLRRVTRVSLRAFAFNVLPQTPPS